MSAESTMPADIASAPFEGPEKLLEIWFAPSAADVPDAHTAEPGKSGLRKVPRETWEQMLDIVQCKVLNAVNGSEMDAYLLSESSFFVSPHRLILKTCGTTLNLLGLPRILEIARSEAGLPIVHRLFYSRKSFMFPDRQQGPHRDWKDEVRYLDDIFSNGSAYTVGKVNGDHWLLYLTTPDDGTAPSSPIVSPADSVEKEVLPHGQDYTIEILMSELAAPARLPFFPDESDSLLTQSPSAHAMTLSDSLGIADIFPRALTTLDAYTFIPCGYSANALLRWGGDDEEEEEVKVNGSGVGTKTPSGEGYYTIHVTPEEGWSYASFECNVPLPAPSPSSSQKNIPDLTTLIRRVVRIFQPGRLSLTLFISSRDNEDASSSPVHESAVEQAQHSFRQALVAADGVDKVYRRTDKINYEFGGYDLAFASFELSNAR